MHLDYKYRALTGGPPRRRRVHRHVLTAGLALAVGGLALGLIPDRARAIRGGEPARAAPLVRQPLALPELPGSGLPVAVEEAPQDRAPVRVEVRPGDSLARIFQDQGLPAAELQRILAAGKAVARLRRLYPGDVLELRRGADGRLERLVLQLDPSRRLEVIRVATADGGSRYEAREQVEPVETRTAYATGIIEDSLFMAGQAAGLSDELIMELAGIFGWDIDFALDIRRGDRFTVLYEERYLGDRRIGTGRILAAAFTNRGKTWRAVLFDGPEGDGHYYSPEGRSMRKSFLRTPVKFTRISSRFSLGRKHPILNRIRAHKGVDYAAPAGTPVRATGDGKVEFKGTRGGYGRVVILRHGNRYSTLYAHLRGYRRGLRTGQRVRQGEIIGYVGSSGLATGPHLHYEFRVDGTHRNPLTVRLPAARPIPEARAAAFAARARPLLVQLEVLDRTLLAAR